MLREDLLKLVQSLPVGCRVIGVGPDSSNTGAKIGEDIEITLFEGARLAMIGVFDGIDIKTKFWEWTSHDYTVSKEEYHQIRQLLDSKPGPEHKASATEVCQVLDRAALERGEYGGHSQMMCGGNPEAGVPPRPELAKLYTKLSDPVCHLLRDQIIWSDEELKVVMEDR